MKLFDRDFYFSWKHASVGFEVDNLLWPRIKTGERYQKQHIETEGLVL